MGFIQDILDTKLNQRVARCRVLCWSRESKTLIYRVIQLVFWEKLAHGILLLLLHVYRCPTIKIGRMLPIAVYMTVFFSAIHIFVWDQVDPADLFVVEVVLSDFGHHVPPTTKHNSTTLWA